MPEEVLHCRVPGRGDTQAACRRCLRVTLGLCDRGAPVLRSQCGHDWRSGSGSWGGGVDGGGGGGGGGGGRGMGGGHAWRSVSAPTPPNSGRCAEAMGWASRVILGCRAASFANRNGSGQRFFDARRLVRTSGRVRLSVTDLGSSWACSVSISKFSRENIILFHSFKSLLLDCSTPATNVPDYLGTFLSHERLLFTDFRRRKAPF